MVDAGFVVAASDYRFSGEALYPAAVEDTLDALAWLRSNADRFGIDPTRVVVFGQSAGGYLAAAEGLDDTIDPVQGVVCWYPLTDFSALLDDPYASDFPSKWLGAPLDTVPESGRTVAPTAPRTARPTAVPAATRQRRHDGPVRPERALARRPRGGGRGVTFETFDGAEHFFVGCDDDTVRGIFDQAMQFARRCVSAD